MISEVHDTPKYILKEIAKDYIPLEIVERKKQGFPVPLEIWFKKEFFNTCSRILLSKKAKIRMIINQKKLEQHLGNLDGQKIWMLLSLELWMEANL